MMAHICDPPELMRVTPLNPFTSTGMDELRTAPFPSWPLAPAPQHFTVSVAVIAQECPSPAATALIPVRPMTSTGRLESISELLPSWPAELLPQHFTVSVSVIPQLCAPPLETALNFCAGGFTARTVPTACA